MRKRLLFRLCFLAAAFALFSCRQDFIPEKEVYNNSSAFQLTSKRISLNEAKHKAKVVAEIEKAKAKIEVKLKAEAKGKVINYGNGVTIDTESVTYIENGPDFHTYTFNITRENALPEDPVENLVLAPLIDGSYKELLVSYDLTSSEKEILMNGGFVDTKGKTTITELAQGTYNPLSKGVTSCGWVETYTFQSCSANEHGSWNPDSWGSCVADRKPGFYSTMTYRCDFIYDTNDPGNGWWAGSGGGSGGGGGGGGSGNAPCTDCPPPPPTEPCNGNGAATGPLDLSTDLGDGSSCTGVPTIITLPPLQVNPCKKAQISTKRANDILHEPNISAEVSSLENHAANSFTEYGMAIINIGTSTVAQDPYSNNDPNNPGTVTITIPPVGDFKASAHTHPSHGAPSPSVADFYIALKNAKNYTTFQAEYIFASNGTKYAFVINDRTKAEAFLAAYPSSSNTTIADDKKVFNDSSALGKDFLNIYESYTSGKFDDYSGNSQNDGLESAFVYILDKYDAGITLTKSDSNGNLKSLRSISFEHIITASGGKKITAHKAQPCP